MLPVRITWSSADGTETVKKLRRLERLEQHIARHQNHLVFTLRWKDLSPSLRIKCSINTKRAHCIKERAKKDLIRERIRVINNKLDSYKEEKDNTEDELFMQLPSNTKGNVVSNLARTHETVNKNTKWRHQQKLERWKRQTKDTETTTDLSDEQLKKWVVNISQYELNEAETKVFAKGLNYTIAPKQIKIEEYIVATEQAFSILPQTEAECLRADMKEVLKSAKPPKSNINNDERNAVKSLNKNETIIILPADKGRAIVVMDKSMRRMYIRC